MALAYHGKSDQKPCTVSSPVFVWLKKQIRDRSLTCSAVWIMLLYIDSLAEHLDMILDHQFCIYCSSGQSVDSYILLQKKPRIERLHENIIFLLNFLGDLAREAHNILRARFTNAVNQANNLFDFGNLKSIAETDLNKEMFCDELEKSVAETDLIR